MQLVNLLNVFSKSKIRCKFTTNIWNTQGFLFFLVKKIPKINIV